MNFVREEILNQEAFTNYNYAMSLAIISQVQTYLVLSGNLNSQSDFSPLLTEMDRHIKFLYDDNKIEELYFLSRASKYLGVTKLGNSRIWKYLKSRFARLNNAASPEQLC